MKVAMKAKDQVSLRSLRAVKSAILIEKTAAKDATFDESAEIKLLQKLVKQRKDSLAIYEEQKRDDLAQTEKEEIEVISQFLPAQLSKEDITTAVKSIIETTGASGMQDMGKVMGMASKQLGGSADGKTIAEIVKQELAG